MTKRTEVSPALRQVAEPALQEGEVNLLQDQVGEQVPHRHQLAVEEGQAGPQRKKKVDSGLQWA